MTTKKDDTDKIDVLTRYDILKCMTKRCANIHTICCVSWSC